MTRASVGPFVSRTRSARNLVLDILGLENRWIHTLWFAATKLLPTWNSAIPFLRVGMLVNLQHGQHDLV